jgi:hypothetical protein
VKAVGVERLNLSHARGSESSLPGLHSPFGYTAQEIAEKQHVSGKELAKVVMMQKEIEATVSLTRECKLNLMAIIDSLKIELEILKSYMERYHPGFAESYPKFKEEAIQAIDPEWISS